MRLLSQTTRYYIWTFLLVMFIHAGFSYLTITFLVHRRLQRALLKEKRTIVQVIQQHQLLPDFPGFGENELAIDSAVNPHFEGNRFQEVHLYSQREEEQIEYYELSTNIQVLDTHYLIQIRRSLVRTNELISSLILSSILAISLLFLGLLVISRWMNRRLWQPFYDSLRQLKIFELRSEKAPHFASTQIQEFDELNQELTILTEKIQQDYQRQKHFVENASHELQTPLAIIKTQLELILQSEHLQENEIQQLATALDAADRLTKINKSLITLSRIDNYQYLDRHELSLTTIISSYLDIFRTEIKSKQLDINIEKSEDLLVEMNETLANMLIQNLIQNAIRHNVDDGQVWINISNRELWIRNTGNPITVPIEKLFQRFFKQSEADGSIGLGLPIIRQICDLYRYPFSYKIEENLHSIRIVFIEQISQTNR